MNSWLAYVQMSCHKQFLKIQRFADKIVDMSLLSRKLI